MKLFGPKSISSYSFYCSRIAAVGSIVLAIFILLSFAFENYSIVDGQFQIAIPFFSELYIKGLYAKTMILSIILIILFIGGFFYVLSLIFKSFKSEKLFTHNAIRHLNLFAVLNLLVFPILYMGIHFMIIKNSNFGSIHNFFLSIVLGIFALFIAAIFKRGLSVQKENDLTI